MKIGILEAWKAAHASEIFRKYSFLPEGMITKIAAEIPRIYKSNRRKIGIGNDLVLAFDDEMTKSYNLIISKQQVYSPTLLEDLRLVRRSIFDIQLVLDTCPIHGIGEKVAYIFEPESADLEFVLNLALDTVKRETLKNAVSLQDKMFIELYSAGMRLIDITGLRFGDIDLKNSRIKTSYND